MGIILGYISLLCFILLIVKICTRKFRFVKVDKALRKLHKPLCCVLTVSCALHIFEKGNGGLKFLEPPPVK